MHSFFSCCKVLGHSNSKLSQLATCQNWDGTENWEGKGCTPAPTPESPPYRWQTAPKNPGSVTPNYVTNIGDFIKIGGQHFTIFFNYPTFYTPQKVLILSALSPWMLRRHSTASSGIIKWNYLWVWVYADDLIRSPLYQKLSLFWKTSVFRVQNKLK